MVDIYTFNGLYEHLKNIDKISSLKDFADKSKYNYTYLSELKNEKKPLTKEFVQVISTRFEVKFNLIVNTEPINHVIASEPKTEYISSHGSGDKLIDSIFEMIRNNEKLINNNTKLVDINAELSNFILSKLKNNENKLNHAS